MKFGRRAVRSVAASAFLALAVSLSATSVQAKGQFLQQSDAAAGQQFGDGLASDGNTLVVSAPGVNNLLPGGTRGVVYVFGNVNGNWVQQAEIRPPSDSVFFGLKAGVLGNTIVVGGTRAPNGVFQSVGYVFTNVNGTWTQQAVLVPAEPHDGIAAVAMDGNTVVLGSAGTGTSAGLTGAAFVFVNNGGVWTEQAMVAPTDSQTGGFGTAVQLMGDTLVVGAPNSNVQGTAAPFTPLPVLIPGTGNQVGNAYVYVRQSGVWTQQAVLIPVDAGFDSQFGEGVAISSDVSGTTVAVGAFTSGDDAAGRVYVFTGLNGVWTQQAKLAGQGVTPRGDFGLSVALTGNTLLVGAYEDTQGPDTGTAHVFKRNGTTWTETVTLFPGSNGVNGPVQEDERFGNFVSMLGPDTSPTFFIGSPQLGTSSAALVGGVYVLH